MGILKNKTVVLGVTGGIACYKACEIVRLLTKAGANVHVILTKGGQQFVTPLSFQALSQNQVYTDIFDLTQESQMGHIKLGDMADLMIVAPATAHFLAKAAHGLCDDLLTTVLCVTRAPVLLAPAMNVHMYGKPVVKQNIKLLKSFGYHFVGPAKGDLACGYEGEGRLEDPQKIVEKAETLLK